MRTLKVAILVTAAVFGFGYPRRALEVSIVTGMSTLKVAILVTPVVFWTLISSSHVNSVNSHRDEAAEGSYRFS